MAIIQLKDGRKIDIKGNPTPEQIDSLLTDLSKSIQSNQQSSNMFERSGMSFTPEQAVAHPYLNAMNKTAQDIISTAAPYYNQLLMNNPRKALEKQGIDFPTPENSIAQGVATAGGALGVWQNPLNKFAAVRAIKGAPTIESIATGAGIGALQGSNNSDERIGNAALGAFTGGAGNVIPKITKNVHRVTLGAVPFLEKTIGAFENTWTKADEAFGNKITELSKANPNKNVDLTSVVDHINATAGFTPKLSALIERTPSLKILVNNPGLAKKVPLREAQDILNQYKANIPEGVLSGRNTDILDMPALQVVDKIKDAQAAAFPEMTEARADIKNVRDKYDLIASKIKPATIESSISNQFGGKLLNKAAKELLKDNPSILKEINSYRRTANSLRAAALAGKIAAGAAVGTTVGRTFGGSLFSK